MQNSSNYAYYAKVKQKQAVIHVFNEDLRRYPHFYAPLNDFPGYYKILLVDEGREVPPEIADLFDELLYVHAILDAAEVLKILSPLKKKYKIHAIFAPLEEYVEVAGFLRSRLGVEGLQESQSINARNKWVMKEVLKQQGIETSAHAIAHSLEDIDAFAGSVGYPIILKPVALYSTTAVEKIASREDALRYADKYRLEDGVLAEKMTQVKYEYCVDSVVEGTEIIYTNISRYAHSCLALASERKPLRVDTMPLSVQETDPICGELLRLNDKVIHGLGLRQTVTHGEFFQTPEDRVEFGEIGARVGGFCLLPPLHKHARGFDIIRASTWLEMRRPVRLPAFRTEDYYSCVGFPIREGVLEKTASREELLAIEGVDHIDLTARPGDRLCFTSTSEEFCGVAIVHAPNQAALDAKIHEVQTYFADRLVVV